MDKIPTPSKPGKYRASFKDPKHGRRIWDVAVGYFNGQVILAVRIGVAVYPIEDFDFWGER